jgi:hypothetical protein
MIQFFVGLLNFNADAQELAAMRKHAAALVRRSAYALNRAKAAGEEVEKSVKKSDTDVVTINNALRGQMGKLK